MKICIVPQHAEPRISYLFKYKPKYTLFSFAYLKQSKDIDKIVKQLKQCDLFLLDSGAFTFMNSGNGGGQTFR